MKEITAPILSVYDKDGNKIPIPAITDITKKDVNQNFANAIKNIVKGSMVAVQDVSPIEHIVKTKVTSTTGETDLSKTELLVSGTSIWDVDNSKVASQLVDYERIPQGFVISRTSVGGGQYLGVRLPMVKTGKYYVRAKIVKTPEQNPEILLFKGGGDYVQTVYDSRGWRELNLQSGVQYRFYIYPDSVSLNPVRIEKLTLSPIPIDKPYDYIPIQKYKPLPNGVVENVKSVSPTMIAYGENIDVEMTYNADTKLYIDNKFSQMQKAILSTGGNV